MTIYTTYNCDALTGDAERALDSLAIAGASQQSPLISGDRAIVAVSGEFLYFTYDATATAAEETSTHPYVVRPGDYSSAGNWEEQEVLAGTIITSTAVIADHTLVRGDGGARKVQDSGITVDDSDNVSGVGTLGCGGITSTGTTGIRIAGTGANTDIIDLVPGVASTYDRLDFKGANTDRGIQFQLNPNGTSTNSKLALANAASSTVFGSVFISTEGGTQAYISSQTTGGGTPVTDLVFGGGASAAAWSKIVFKSGNIAVGDITPTAALHLKAGTAAAGTGPLKFTSGTLLTSAEDGVIEYLSNVFYIRGSDGLRIGSSTNYTNIAADGTLEFNGDATVWKDANVGAAMLSKPAASQPTETQFVDEAAANTGIYALGFAAGEKVSGTIEIPHDYKEGSDITFHVHWQGAAAPTDTDYVKWQLEYTVGQVGTTLDAITTISTTDAAVTQYNFNMTSFAAITGTNFNIGDQFLFTLTRVAADGAAYAGVAITATVGFHYEVDTVGSRQIATK